MTHSCAAGRGVEVGEYGEDEEVCCEFSVVTPREEVQWEVCHGLFKVVV